ncbi:(Na+)-NQR maturation NqrM [Proteobacteria bacterium 005FR1]|nr:(Na+)-NQR maturation NqrM [Proteobacteria bacterium 005FR1]
MLVVFLSVCILLAVVAIMSVGVIMGREPIKGSCGGMSALGMDTACDICGGDKNRCEKTNELDSDDEELGNLAYEASSEKKH